jgi:hypothetical protein
MIHPPSTLDLGAPKWRQKRPINKGFPQIHGAQTLVNTASAYREYLHQKQGNPMLPAGVAGEAGPMCPQVRREYLLTMRSRYAAGGRSERARLLDEVVAVTGLHRKQGLHADSCHEGPLRSLPTIARQAVVGLSRLRVLSCAVEGPFGDFSPEGLLKVGAATPSCAWR